ncbi:S8 family serine peptidase [Roseateles sp. DAIF2]|uniref:S8 family peptidase n=1 Tax=Roseateles sp. DAIF2 TaxID=2714952 RepID=UPI0018A2D269|nr:S8 family peptidase [Roseateles sp. DAIF2]QPF75112.1 S8 family serine peptidase [Roseateles sp. DAIF2]
MLRLKHLSQLIALSWATLTAAHAGVSAVDIDQPNRPRSEQTDRLIVKYRDGSVAVQLQNGPALQARALAGEALTSRTEAAQRLAAPLGARLSLLRQMGTGAHVFKLDRALSVEQLQQLAAQLQASDANIEYAEPDRKMYALLTPNDSSYSSQWDLFEATGGIRAPAAWDRATGTGVVVAVIDTGHRPHADLTGQLVAGYDMITQTATANDGNGRDSDPSDPGDWSTAGECGTGQPARNSSWHGTHVAGTIAAKTNNSLGVAGIAFNAKIQPVRVLGKCGGYTSDIADGITWASGGSVSGLPANATPAKVLNLSLGGSGSCGTTTQNAVNGARSRGASVIVAAGNSNANASGFTPASCSGVVTVAATDRYGARAYYSNYGTVVALAAPGGDVRSSSSNGILSTLNAGTSTPGADNYSFYQGTSMAAPHVAGVAALLYSAKPSATPDQITAALKGSARAFPGTCSQCGTGLLDADAAITAILGGGGTTIAETEPNNSIAAAQVVNAPGTVNGGLSSNTDTDYFRISLPAGRTLSVNLGMGATLDYDLYLLNGSGTQLRASENPAGQSDSFTYINSGTSAVTVYVRVLYYSGGAGGYTLGLNW